jgi:hypothetical protein
MSLTVKVEFERPQRINGSEVSEVELDFTSMKGKGIMEQEGIFRQLYKGYTPVPDIDCRFQALVAAAALKINPRDLEEIDADCFKQVCAAVRDFLVK